MFNFSNQVFTGLVELLKANYVSLEIKGEYVDAPSNFPAVAFEEVFNVPSYLDNGGIKYADVTYRVRVFAKTRTEAREIYSTIVDYLYSLNLIAKTYTVTPSMYGGRIYEIQSTFEGSVDKNGRFYRR